MLQGVKANLALCKFFCFLGAKKMCLQFAIFNSSKKLHYIFEIGLKTREVIVQKWLLEKLYFEINNLQTCFFFYVFLHVTTVQLEQIQ